VFQAHRARGKMLPPVPASCNSTPACGDGDAATLAKQGAQAGRAAERGRKCGHRV